MSNLSLLNIVNGRCYLKGFNGNFRLERFGGEWRIIGVDGHVCKGDVFLEYQSVKEVIRGIQLQESDLYKYVIKLIGLIARNIIDVDGKGYPTFMASYGPIIKGKFRVNVVLQKMSSGLLSHGCVPSDYINTTGKFSVVKRGECTFVEKSIAASKAKASGLIIANIQNKAFLMTNNAGDLGDDILIPIMMMTRSNAVEFVNAVNPEKEVGITEAGVVEKSAQKIGISERIIVNLRVVESERDILNENRKIWK